MQESESKVRPGESGHVTGTRWTAGELVPWCWVSNTVGKTVTPDDCIAVAPSDRVDDWALHGAILPLSTSSVIVVIDGSG